MKRMTITLPDQVIMALQREARRLDTSVSEVARRALIAQLGLSREQPRHVPFASLGDGGHRHTARDIEDILAEEWCSGSRQS
jgi:hypothetical protein